MKSMKAIFADADYINTGARERIISALAGLTLLGMGVREIRKPSVKTWGELGVGALLLFRGVSGFCPINKLMGRDGSIDTSTASED